MDFSDFLTMLTEAVSKNRRSFLPEGVTEDMRRLMTSGECAVRSGALQCAVHLTAEGKISETQTGAYVSFAIRPAAPLPEG